MTGRDKNKSEKHKAKSMASYTIAKDDNTEEMTEKQSEQLKKEEEARQDARRNGVPQNNEGTTADDLADNSSGSYAAMDPDKIIRMVTKPPPELLDIMIDIEDEEQSMEIEEEKGGNEEDAGDEEDDPKLDTYVLPLNVETNELGKKPTATYTEPTASPSKEDEEMSDFNDSDQTSQYEADSFIAEDEDREGMYVMTMEIKQHMLVKLQGDVFPTTFSIDPVTKTYQASIESVREIVNGIPHFRENVMISRRDLFLLDIINQTLDNEKCKDIDISKSKIFAYNKLKTLKCRMFAQPDVYSETAADNLFAKQPKKTTVLTTSAKGRGKKKGPVSAESDPIAQIPLVNTETSSDPLLGQGLVLDDIDFFGQTDTDLDRQDLGLGNFDLFGPDLGQADNALVDQLVLPDQLNAPPPVAAESSSSSSSSSALVEKTRKTTGPPHYTLPLILPRVLYGAEEEDEATLARTIMSFNTPDRLHECVEKKKWISIADTNANTFVRPAGDPQHNLKYTAKYEATYTTKTKPKLDIFLEGDENRDQREKNMQEFVEKSAANESITFDDIIPIFFKPTSFPYSASQQDMITKIAKYAIIHCKKNDIGTFLTQQTFEYNPEALDDGKLFHPTNNVYNRGMIFLNLVRTDKSKREPSFEECIDNPKLLSYYWFKFAKLPPTISLDSFAFATPLTDNHHRILHYIAVFSSHNGNVAYLWPHLTEILIKTRENLEKQREAHMATLAADSTTPQSLPEPIEKPDAFEEAEIIEDATDSIELQIDVAEESKKTKKRGKTKKRDEGIKEDNPLIPNVFVEPPSFYRPSIYVSCTLITNEVTFL